MHALLGPLRAVLTDSNANAYLLFGVSVFLTVLVFLYLVSLGSSKKGARKSQVAGR